MKRAGDRFLAVDGRGSSNMTPWPARQKKPRPGRYLCRQRAKKTWPTWWRRLRAIGQAPAASVAGSPAFHLGFQHVFVVTALGDAACRRPEWRRPPPGRVPSTQRTARLPPRIGATDKLGDISVRQAAARRPMLVRRRFAGDYRRDVADGARRYRRGASHAIKRGRPSSAIYDVFAAPATAAK